MSTMLPTIGLLLGCQLFGEVATRGLGLPIPGPVLGLAVFMLILWMKPGTAGKARATVGTILANLSLLFVPAGVGVIGNLEVLAGDWFALLIILVISTLLSMLAAVATFMAVNRLVERRSE